MKEYNSIHFFIVALLFWATHTGLAGSAIPNGLPEPLLTPEERKWLADHPVIKLASEPYFPPIAFFDEKGNYRGIAADYHLGIIEKMLGIKYQIIHFKNWTEVLDGAKSGKTDVIGSAAKTPSRSEYLLFTTPYISLPAVIITRPTVKKNLTLKDLKGMRVSVVGGYAVQEYIKRNYPEINLDPVLNVEIGLRKVSFGLVDAFVENLGTATFYIEKGGITNLHVAGETGFVYQLSFASRKDWPILNSILQKALDGIPPEKRQAILRKWVQIQPPPLISSTQLLVGILLGLGVVSITIVAILVWNRTLKRNVRQRTAELNAELAERQRVENEIRQLNEELESRVSQRTAELQTANAELQSFSYSVSHDLRAPLRSIGGFSNILLEDYAGNLDAKGLDYLKRIGAASQRMAQLIDDLLNLARITRNPLIPTLVNLTDLAADLIGELRRSHPDRHVEIVIAPELKAWADQNLMRIALQNLLENAWKFTGKNLEAKIEFGSCLLDGNPTFFIRDNGAGFDMTFVDKLFSPFQRFHSADEFEGTGIGLATVYRIIHRHGGRIWAHGELNKGAAFFFTLP
jgi:signal transduction histidine kinase